MPPTPTSSHGSSPVAGRPSALRRPHALAPGDRVAVIAPSGPIDRERLAAGVRILEDWGLEVVPSEHLLDAHPTAAYLAGSDENRAADFQRAWLDPTIAAVICARGGYGVQRMVDLIDWDRLRPATPKALVGFSDVTTLHETVAQRLGVATLYGPMVAAQAFATDHALADHLRRTLFSPAETTILTSPTAAPLISGRAHGITAGGCASVLASDRGTPTARPSFAGMILLLEDIGEHPYQLDRILTQLIRTGALDGVRGIALGSWEGCGTPSEVRALMKECLAPLGVPVIWELGFGHGPAALTVPLGVPAHLDADAGTLTFDLPALADSRRTADAVA
ncbi:peptidase U61 [Kitasatospora sp. MMS16-BH015]|uniref:S66 peptidase family protein n=1 Tax=Kitasatospora sp. MMS16-BH015 TaxID=2018025 RepID=UPI000CA311AA|nr:LD-carboxypeptidase [Kitasatospora sp. MMS16-BH015]AUG77323.1 peptidase U61 [Kitasatospora sp. MMS16-BH015]